MSRRRARSAVRWLIIGSAAAAVAFALLSWGQPHWAAAVGTPATALLVLAGLETSRATRPTAPRPKGDRDPVPRRARQLVVTSLVAFVGVLGFGLVYPTVEATMGPVFGILVAALAMLGPALVVLVLVWLVDGITLRYRIDEAGDPLVGASLAIGLAFAIATVATVTLWSTSLSLLVAIGGLAPCLFVLWSLANAHGMLSVPRVETVR